MRALDDLADGQVGGPLGEVAPGHEALAHPAGEEPGVQHHEPRDAVGVLDRPAQPDRAAPVLDDDGDVLEVERVEVAADRLDVAVVRVPALVGRLVGAAEADEVGADHAVPARDEPVEHVPVEVAPARLAVEAEDGRPAPLVEVVQAQAVDLDVVGLVGEARQVLEALVGRAEDVHGFVLSSGGPAGPSRWMTASQISVRVCTATSAGTRGSRPNASSQVALVHEVQGARGLGQVGRRRGRGRPHARERLLDERVEALAQRPVSRADLLVGGRRLGDRAQQRAVALVDRDDRLDRAPHLGRLGADPRLPRRRWVS